MSGGRDREARLAAALRANLRRRKAQARDRSDDGPAADDGRPGQSGDEPAADGS